MHALIIEDEAMIALVIEEYLNDLGFTCCTADTEAGAIAAAEARCPDLIVADNRLIEGSGVDAVRTICAGLIIPVVYTCGDPEGWEGELQHGVLLGKPFTSGSFRASVADALDRAREVQG